MAQKQKTPKQPQDRYGQRAKSLASSVQRLRGWVGSDPSRTPELADALVQLTEHRLLGHGFPLAAADAQDAVRLAAQLLTANGPIGPYTAVADATRCVTAMVHVATIQVGLRRPEPAGQMMRSVQDLQQQLRDVGVTEQLSPRVQVWSLTCTAAAALASGEVAAANRDADSALALASASGIDEDLDAVYLVIDVDRLVSDCRWSAGRAQESLTHLHQAKDRYDELVAGRLAEPGRLSPALVERLAEPLFGLYRDLADRLAATGEVDHGLAIRRTLVELLQGLSSRLGEPAQVQLALALADLADDLLAADRVDEAGAAATEAAAAVPGSPSGKSAQLLATAAHARVLLRAGHTSHALTMLRPLVSGDQPGVSPATQAVALYAWADALRADGDLDTAATAEQMGADLAERSVAAYLARGVLSPGALADIPLSPVAAADATPEQQRETAAWLEAERAEAHRLERKRMEQARLETERRLAEQQRAEQLAAEREQAEREQAEREQRLEAERQAAAEEEERIARKGRREERIEAHRRETEEQELAAAESIWRDAKARGDRRAARTANEQVVELLRSRAEQDLPQYGPHLLQALEELSSARLRSGDVWGSRAPAREARALARALGR